MTRTHHAIAVPPAVIRRAIARALVGQARAEAGRATHADPREPAHTAETLGEIALFPHQRDAVAQLRGVVQQHHVAVLADEVGLGKTFVALALARGYEHACVIAPAALLPMWRAALQQAADTTTSLHSLHAYSRTSRAPQWSARTHHPSVPPSRILVIIDEAHHVRTPSTRRYGAVAAAVAGCDLLLVSATPIHNRSADLRALLALTLGSQVEKLNANDIAELVVRRRQAGRTPTVRTHPPLAVPQNTDVLNALLAIPAPLPAQDGAVAGALIKLGLLRAWCSSDAALLSQLRRRIMRSEALQHAIRAGRHPTTTELRSWVLGDDDMQLGFPELLATHPVADGSVVSILDRHIEALQFAAARLRTGLPADPHRIGALRDVLRTHPQSSIVAFSQYAETIRAVARGLADIAGVGALTGQRAWIASGPIRRQEVLEAFAPRAHGRPPPPAHQHIRLLLSTDLLAEGVNLQDANIVVHLDLPWTHALREQRVGRCARVGSLHHEVHVYTLQPHRRAAAVLRLHDRLHRKAHIAATFVGVHGPQRRLSSAESASQLRTWVASWSQEADNHLSDLTWPFTHGCAVAVVPSRSVSAIVLVRDSASRLHLLAASSTPRPVMHRVRGNVSRARTHRYKLSANSRTLVQLLSRVVAYEQHQQTAGASPCPSHCPAAQRWHADASALQRAAVRWCARQHLTAELGERESDATPVHRRARRQLQSVMARGTLAQQTARQRAYREALHMIAAVRGREAERALDAWVATTPACTPDLWIIQWREWPVLVQCAEVLASAAAPPSHTGRGRRAQICAMVLFRPCEATNFGACHDTPCSSISTAP